MATLLFICMLRAPLRLSLAPLRSLSRMATAVPITSACAIHLDDTEARFVSLLDEFSRGYNPPIECRIAGGWVRDKASSPSH